MATPQTVRHLNEIRALNALFRHTGMSRADLARALGLNRSTTGNIITGLITEGLAVERRDEPHNESAGKTGRPGIRVQIDPAGASFLGAEIGVDRLTVVVIDMRAEEILRLTLPFPTHRETPEAGTDRMVALIAEAIESLDRPERLRGLCVTLPALLASDGTVINGLMLGWRDVKLRDMVTDRLKRRFPSLDPAISIENDANAFAIAETYRDTTHRSETVAFLLIENGAGGGIVIGGRLLRGSAGFAGEFGQIVLGGHSIQAGRSKPGHLESYIGKDALLGSYHAQGGEADLDRLLQGLARGEAAALATARAWGERLAAGLIQVTSVLNPGLIILGGSVAPVFTHVAAEVSRAMQRELLEGFPLPRIEVSALGVEGPALGGALLMHQRMFSIDESAIYASEQPITLFQS
ncbi:ROK family transcriptional regulator [Labrys sp. LIt4]|uniref:ROK family transcriptional regulator n=1 Tax=Labrys sp. LIt4 TaxID=2821355 RepID=UPI001ADFF84A|nr:ROK family transcriptional regulator [Labrys sp. LIt4]MBP0579809.1 ROK family transcriptional regulator [Labrys sp. LIt4]